MMLLFLSVCFLLINMASAFHGFSGYFSNQTREHTRITTCFGYGFFRAKKIIIKLMKDSKNVVFYFMADFNVAYRGIRTECNALINGKWVGREVKHSLQEYRSDGWFQIDIEMEEEAFKVYVNNRFVVQYANCLKPLRNIKWIDVFYVWPRIVEVWPISEKEKAQC